MTCRDKDCELPADRHCPTCPRHINPPAETCIPCLHQARSNLWGIYYLFLEIRAQLDDPQPPSQALEPTGRRSADTPMPGGDALALVTRGNTDGRPDAGIELADDPHPPLSVLDSWDDAIRQARRFTRTGGTPYLPAVVRSIDANLDWCAKYFHGYHDLVRELRRIRGRLEAAARISSRPERGVPCLECGEQLRQHYDDPDPCPAGCNHIGGGHDQGGRRDHWTCPNPGCTRRRYTPTEYRNAVWQAWYEQTRETQEDAS